MYAVTDGCTAAPRTPAAASYARYGAAYAAQLLSCAAHAAVKLRGATEAERLLP
jgi:hypothetical protein